MDRGYRRVRPWVWLLWRELHGECVCPTSIRRRDGQDNWAVRARRSGWIRVVHCDGWNTRVRHGHQRRLCISLLRSEAGRLSVVLLQPRYCGGWRHLHNVPILDPDVLTRHPTLAESIEYHGPPKPPPGQLP